MTSQITMNLKSNMTIEIEEIEESISKINRLTQSILHSLKLNNTTVVMTNLSSSYRNLNLTKKQ